MLVFGDHDRTTCPRAALLELHGQAARVADAERGLAWHAACASLLWDMAGLLQGLDDAAFARDEVDDVHPWQAPLTTALLRCAGALNRSWNSGFGEQHTPDLAGLAALAEQDLPAEISIRRCEGYAYYALYPELFAAAAQGLPAGAVVIGLRSIGCALAAVVAQVAGAGEFYTLRPIGHPFGRKVSVAPDLRKALLARPEAPIVIVDEGPGLSGSSFGGVADWLESEGVSRDRTIFLPSHDGELGTRSQPRHRERWRTARRMTASFDDVILPRLPSWFQDVTGTGEIEVHDLSGGAWRRWSPWPDAPADPMRETRKYLLRSGRGDFLLRFIGLDAQAEIKFDRACRLHGAGYATEPLGFRYGFSIEPWMAQEARPQRDEIVSRLPSYLAFRANAFTAKSNGASLTELAAMARKNCAEAIGEDAECLFAPWNAERLTRLQDAVRPAHVDGRLQAWEWIATRDGLLKTDAVDHSGAHDLIGCQDIAWDVAGACVEYKLSGTEREQMIAAVLGGRPEAGEMVDFLALAYLGFQVGWWSFASDARGLAWKNSYTARIAALVAACGREKPAMADIDA